MSGTDLELSCVIVLISGPFNAVLDPIDTVDSQS